MEAFTTKGHWWLPEDPDNELDGELAFDPSRRPKLALSGSFESIESERAFVGTHEPIILGVGEKGQAITLVDCPTPGSGFSSSDYIWMNSTYYPKVIIQGHHYTSKDEILLERIRFDYYGLNEWASTRLSWGVIDFDNIESIRSALEKTPIECFQTNELKLILWRDYNWSLPRDSISIKRGVWIEIVPHSQWTFEEYLHKIDQLRVFLSLAMRKPTWPLTVNFPSPENANKLVSVHFGLDARFRVVDDPFRHGMLFTLNEIQPKLVFCLENWFVNFKKLERILRLYQNVIYFDLHPEDEFLTLARSVEAYHRLTHDNFYVREEQFSMIYEAMISAIPDNTVKDFKNRLKGYLCYANHLALRRRLKELGKSFPQSTEALFESNRKFKSFVDIVVEKRNKLTHLEETGDSEKEYHYGLLRCMNAQLLSILEICLLSKLGLNDEEAKQIVSNFLLHTPLPPRPQPPQPAS